MESSPLIKPTLGSCGSSVLKHVNEKNVSERSSVSSNFIRTLRYQMLRTIITFALVRELVRLAKIMHEKRQTRSIQMCWVVSQKGFYQLPKS